MYQKMCYLVMTKTQPNHIKICLAQPQDRNQIFAVDINW